MLLRLYLGQFAVLGVLAASIGCALGYLDFRFPDKIDWRARAPGLAAWYADFAKRPSMLKTRPDV